MLTSVVPLLLTLALQQGTARSPIDVAGPAITPPSLESVHRTNPNTDVPDILAACWSTDSVVRFDGRTGQFEGNFTVGGPLRLPAGVDFGPEGNLYVTSFYWDTVLKYDGETGDYLGTFVSEGLGGLNQPGLLKFRPDGFLYVLASYDGGVLRYDAQTGAFHDVIIPSGAGGITTAFAMTFGPDGDIYLGGYYSNEVVRFDGRTGAVKWVVAPYVDTPSGMTFGPDGMLLVGEWRAGGTFHHNIRSYAPDAQSMGEHLTDLAEGPLDLQFGRDGWLYVAGSGSIDVRNGLTGEWIDSMYQPGIQNLMAITFTPAPPLRLRLPR